MEVHEESRIYTRYTFYPRDLDVIILQISVLVDLARPLVAVEVEVLQPVSCVTSSNSSLSLSIHVPFISVMFKMHP